MFGVIGVTFALKNSFAIDYIGSEDERNKLLGVALDCSKRRATMHCPSRGESALQHGLGILGHLDEDYHATDVDR